MEILIYNTVKGHDELLGFLLDYFNKLDIVPDVLTKNALDWLTVYEKKYHFNEITKLESQYHYAISLNEYKQKDIVDSYALEYIYCKHSAISLGSTEKGKVYLYVSPSQPNFVIPCFSWISFQEKQRALMMADLPTIAIVGRFKEAARWLDNIKNLKDFRVIHINKKATAREMIYGDHNVEQMIGLPTEDMFDVCAKSAYVLSVSSHLRKDIQSGSINMAFTLGCRLILRDSDRNKYNLNSPIYIKEKEGIILPIEPELDAVFIERDKLIEKSRSCINSSITDKIPKVVHCRVPDSDESSWPKRFHKALSSLRSILRPDIYEYKFWTNDNIEALIQEEYPWLDVGYKAIGEENVLRLLALYKYGGITFSPDLRVPSNDFYGLLKHDAVNVSHTGAMAAMPGHDMLLNHLKTIVESSDKKISVDRLRVANKTCNLIDARNNKTVYIR